MLLKDDSQYTVVVTDMKASSLAAPALAAWLVYLILELLFGVSGVVAFRALEETRERAREDIALVQERRRYLEQTIRGLTTDPQMIILEARDLGLVSPEDRIFRVQGHDARPVHRYIPGSVPRPVVSVRDNRPLFRALALAVFLALVTISLTVQGSEGKGAGQRNFRFHRSEGSRETEETASEPREGGAPHRSNRRHSR